MIPTLLLRYWKPIGGAVALLAAVWLIWAQVHAYGARREAEGRAAVQGLWDADTANRDRVTAQAMADKLETEHRARLNNEVIEREYQAKVAAATADRDSTLRLLQQARNQVSGLTSGKATGDRGLDVLAGIASRAAEVDRRLVQYDESCRKDAVKLTALQAEVRAQL